MALGKADNSTIRQNSELKITTNIWVRMLVLSGSVGQLVPRAIVDIIRLTTREQQILELLAQGKSSKEIASALRVTVATVASHRKALCRKLNIHSVAGLVHWATRVCCMRHDIHGVVLPTQEDCLVLIFGNTVTYYLGRIGDVI